MEYLRDLLDLEKLIMEISQALREAPEGGLRATKNHGYYQYYRVTQSGDVKGEYLKKKDRKIAEALAQRDYDKEFMQKLEELKQCHEKATQIYQEKGWMNHEGVIIYEKLWDTYQTLGEGRKRLVNPRILSDEEYIKEWEAVSYKGKSFQEETSEIYTEKGERVRSKSEKLIADKLYMMAIPYRYECSIYLKGMGKVYPDFTLLHIKTRKEIIWEHFGMMEDPVYASSAVRKICAYQANGYYQGINLITTFETKQTVPNMRDIERMLKRVL